MSEKVFSDQNITRFFLIVFLTLLFTGFTFLFPTAVADNISGSVTDGNKNLSFARVRLQATQISAITDINGKFTLQGITSSDSVVITAWAEGYYNGKTKALAGDTNVVITLNKLPLLDDTSYQFLSPDPDSLSSLNCGNCHSEVLMNQWRSDAHGRSAKNPFLYAMYNGTDIDGNPNIGFGYKRDSSSKIQFF